MAKFWLQQKAPSGNWTDNMGSDELPGLVSHKKYLEQGQVGGYRIVLREDTEINTEVAGLLLVRIIDIGPLDAFYFDKEHYVGSLQYLFEDSIKPSKLEDWFSAGTPDTIFYQIKFTKLGQL